MKPEFSSGLEAESERQGDHAGARYYRGRKLMAVSQLEEAVVSFRESAAVYPHFKCLELLGECLLKLDRPLEAIIPLAAAARLNRQVRAPALLALAFLRIGEAERAAELAEEVYAKAPSNRVAKQVLADPVVVRALAARRGNVAND